MWLCYVQAAASSKQVSGSSPSPPRPAPVSYGVRLWGTSVWSPEDLVPQWPLYYYLMRQLSWDKDRSLTQKPSYCRAQPSTHLKPPSAKASELSPLE